MMVDRLGPALRHELRTLPARVAGLRRNGWSWGGLLRFFAGRFFCPERGGQRPAGLLTPHGFRLYTRRDFVLYEELFALDEYRAALWQEALRHAERPLVLDLGANVGLFGALCATQQPRVWLIAFEMVPDGKPVIERRLRECGCVEGTVVTGAVGAESQGTRTIRYDHPHAASNAVTATAGRHAVAVPCIALDDWMARHGLAGEPLTLIKIDVEGAERDVWQGGRETIRRAEFVLLELHAAAFRALLDELDETHERLADIKKGPELWLCILRRRP